MVESNKEDERKVTFWDHLIELIHRLRRIFYSIIIFTIIVMVFPVDIDLSSLFSSNPQYITIATFIIRKIQEDFLPSDVELMPISWFAPLEVYFYISIILGVAISLPVIAYELYRFINPALYKHERKILFPFIVSFTGLFIIGFIIGYTLILPMSIRALLLFTRPFNLALKYEFASFFSLAAGGLFVSGLIFTFPVFFVALVKAGIVRTELITKNRKYLYAGVIITISILDPDPTLVTEIFLGIPVLLLLEASTIIARRFEKPRN